MGKVKANLSRGYAVAVLACLACAWSRPSFAASPSNPSPTTPLTATSSATNQSDPALDSEPDPAVEFSEKAPAEEKSEGKKTEAAVVTDSPDKKSIFPSFRLAPIRLSIGGSVGYSISRQTSGTMPAVMQQGLNTTLNVLASSYIWQPWMATVNGGINYANSLSGSSGNLGGLGMPNSSVNGNAELRVFPYSRYPFAASFSQGESFTGYGIGAPNTQNTRFKLDQTYTPWHRKDQYAVSLTRLINGGLNLPKSREDTLDFRASTTRYAKQSHSVDGSSSLLHLPLTGTVLNNRLVSSHSYTPDSSISFSGGSNANYTNTHVAQTVSNIALLQLNGFASWRPEGAPYYLVSAIRGLGMNSSSDSGQAPSKRITNRGVFTNVSGVYTINRYINLSASANYSTQDNNGTRTQSGSLASNQNANVNYPLPSINFGDLHYSRGVSGSFSNRSSTQAGRHATQTMSVSPRHSLGRSLDWMGAKVALNLGQSVAIGKTSRAPETAAISHVGSVNLSHSAGKKVSTLSMSASDSRALMGVKTASQMINLQAGLDIEVNHNSSWTGNLTMQAARSSDGQMMSPFISSSSANLGYRNQRMFNIPRMIFKSDLRMASKSLMPVLANTQAEPTLYWANNLTYNLGRMQMRLEGDLSQVQNVTSTLIMFTVTRSFGAG